MILHKRLIDYAQITEPVFLIPNPNPTDAAVYIIGRGVSQAEHDQIVSDLNGCVDCANPQAVIDAKAPLLQDIANIS